MVGFESFVESLRALPAGAEAQVVAALLLGLCLVVAAVWPVRVRRERMRPRVVVTSRTEPPLVQLHRPPLPWQIER